MDLYKLVLTALAITSCLVANAQKSRKALDSLDSTGYITVRSIEIVGNDKTKEYIITRELSFVSGDSIATHQLEEILQKSRNNVYNTNLFSTVEFETAIIDSATIDLTINLEERWYVWPSFTLKPIDRNLVDWWTNRDKDFSRVRFGPKLDIYNVRGRKESLRFIGLFGFDRRFIFQYSIPYIDKNQKHGLVLGASSILNKKMPYETVGHVNNFITDTSEYVNQVNAEAWSGFLVYKYRPSFYDYHYLTLQGYDMTISDDIARLNPNYFGDGATNQTALGLSYSYVRDRRDNRNYPLSGYYGLGVLEKLGLGIFKDVDIWRMDLQYQHFVDLGQKWYFSSGIGAQLSSPNASYFNYTEFGQGTYYVRGFEQFIVEGPYNFLTKNSIKREILKTKFNLGRFMPIKKFKKIPFAIYAKAFADAGYVVNYENYEQNSRLTDKPLYSLGVGLDLVMLYDITLRLEYSYNSEGQFKFAPNVMAEL
ncbi:BamA/TamA family outer membrane protein [Marinoscillum sp.]|uniref:BamA/TamA family outer membrane protein n=1 Tax=Marinoscillum sp. TaxID=2024838 RepID=UPI003BA93942